MKNKNLKINKCKSEIISGNINVPIIFLTLRSEELTTIDYFQLTYFAFICDLFGMTLDENLFCSLALGKGSSITTLVNHSSSDNNSMN